MTSPVKIVMVLDSSGSMQSLKEATINAHNEFIRKQKSLEGEATYSLYTFSSNVNDPITASIDKAAELNPFNYRPGGGTALYDAIGKAISVEVTSGSQGILVILTDGEENGSRLFNKDQIAKMIKDAEDAHGWEVVFLGANIANFTQFTQSLNLKAVNSMTLECTAKGMSEAYGSIGATTTAYRASKLKMHA